MPSTQQTYDFIVVVTIAMCAYWIAMAGMTTTPTTTSMSTTSTITTVDRNTGLVFDSVLKFPTVGKLHLVGVGTRKKAILNIYSVGVYVSPSMMKPWKAKTKDDDSKQSRCQTQLLDTKAARAVQLQFHMGIGAEKIAEAVSGIPGVSAKTKQAFQDLIVNGIGPGKLQKREVMTFEWKGQDFISVSVRGKVVGSLRDKTLAKGVLSLYVGPKSVSPSLLQDLECR